MSMTDKQIKQNAEEYADALYDRKYQNELWRENYGAHIAGAHSRDEEIKELKEEIESMKENEKELFEGFKKRGTKLAELMKENVKLRNPWISVEERLPERIHKDCNYSKECFVHCYDKECEWNGVAQYNYAKQYWEFDNEDCSYETVVQFWMPVPKL